MLEKPDVGVLVARLRADTPGCAHRVHLNNAGASLMPSPVVEAIHAHLEREVFLGGYEAADEARSEITASYDAVAELVGARSSNIAVVENATVAVAQALSAIPFDAGDVVLTTRQDYVSNQIMLLNLAQRFGIRIVRASDLPEGGVDPESVKKELEKYRPKCMLMTWIPTNSGLVQNARAVGELCSEAGVGFLLDACQAVGQLPIDVGDLRCDYLAATARKFLRGPRGTGFLYVSDRVLEEGACPLFVDLHGASWLESDSFSPLSDARRFENWEFAYALVVGMGAAARYALDIGVDVAGARAAELAAYTRERLSSLPVVRVLDAGPNLCAIVSAQIVNARPEDLVIRLRERDINTSAIDRSSAVIDMDAKGADSALRVSPHCFNTHDEIDQFVGALSDFLE